ncbi:MAG TPA: hypothetical protein PKC43_04285 [Phycisphaerales bacterium]|nr:hypothetical protein [Phycisphaerales bacterium]HMP36646.1 hypothetical protein [Phycisphaerales bacterium]
MTKVCSLAFRRLAPTIVGAAFLLHCGPMPAPALGASGWLDWRRHAVAHPVATSSPLLPPPSPYLSLLPRFFQLLESYVALDAGDKIPFATWVVLNGISDPRIVAGTVILSEWYHRAAGAE